jgi:hypothetical protein
VETRALGRVGPRVSSLGLGCMRMSDLYGPADRAESVATIHAALDAGVTLLDTGDFYGMGDNARDRDHRLRCPLPRPPERELVVIPLVGARRRDQPGKDREGRPLGSRCGRSLPDAAHGPPRQRATLGLSGGDQAEGGGGHQPRRPGELRGDELWQRSRRGPAHRGAGTRIGSDERSVSPLGQPCSAAALRLLDAVEFACVPGVTTAELTRIAQREIARAKATVRRPSAPHDPRLPDPGVAAECGGPAPSIPGQTVGGRLRLDHPARRNLLRHAALEEPA